MEEKMIIGTGVDIIEINRVKKAISKEYFKKRVFTAQEINYCEQKGVQKAASYAARFAGKEAVLKALGTGLIGGRLLDIEILVDELGAPKVTLTGFFANLAEQKKVSRIHLSLSHAQLYAVAQVILEGEF